MGTQKERDSDSESQMICFHFVVMLVSPEFHPDLFFFGLHVFPQENSSFVSLSKNVYSKIAARCEYE